MKEKVLDLLHTYCLTVVVFALGIFGLIIGFGIKVERIQTVSYLSGLGVVVMACFAVTKWNKERAAQKADNLYSLIQKFNTKNVNNVFDIVENARRGTVVCAFKSVGSRKILFEVLTLCDYMCYLLSRRLILQSEFGFFAYKIKRIVSHPEVYRFLISYVAGLDETHGKDGTFASLYHYALSHKWIDMDDEVQEGESSGRDEGAITAEDFKEPTLVIRINRLYREGMSDDEVYEVARGNWRVNAQKIGRYKYALAVAEGQVKGVYAIDYWESPDGERIDIGCAGTSDRIRFVRKDVAPAEMSLYKGRSVRGMFCKGDAYPVRYFEGEVLKSKGE